MDVELKISSGYDKIISAGIAFLAFNMVTLLKYSVYFSLVSLFGMIIGVMVLAWYRRNPCVVVRTDGVFLLAPLRTRVLRFGEIQSWSFDNSMGVLKLWLRSGKRVACLVADDNLDDLGAVLAKVGIPKAE